MSATADSSIPALTHLDRVARVLNRNKVDLGDERAVMRALQRSGMDVCDILDVMDAAVERARVLRQAIYK